MKITFIRHGESFHNVEFKKHGEKAYYELSLRNSNLTTAGISQAETRSKDLDLEDVQVVFVSPVLRALQTADIIFSKKEVMIIALDSLRELNLEHSCNNKLSVLEINELFPEFITDELTSTDEAVSIFKTSGLINFDIFELDKLIKDLPDFIHHIAVVGHNDSLVRYTGLTKPIQNCGRIDVIV